MIPESELVSTVHGLVPKGQGWFVVNARETQWWERKGRGVLCEFEGAGFEGATDFVQLGINLTVLAPGEPMAMYHRENDEEDFLVLAGEALAIVEGEERPLRRWDFLHCPPGTNHVIVGAGEGPCVSSRSAPATGRRAPTGAPTPSTRPLDATAPASNGRRPSRARHTRDSPSGELTRYRDGWLPE